MKLNLYLIAEQCTKLIPEFQNAPTLECELQNIYLMHKNAQCQKEYVYLVEKSSLSFLKEQDNILELSFVIIGEPADFPFLSDNWNILFLQTSSDVPAVYEHLQKVFESYQRWEQELTTAILSHAPLQIQLDKAAEFFHNPIALFDMSFSTLAWSGNVPEHFDDPIWESVINKGYNMIRNLPPKSRNPLHQGIKQRTPAVIPPFGTPSDNRIMTASLFFNGNPIANLSMDELCQPFTIGEYSLLCHVQHLLEYSSSILEQVSLFEDGGSHLFSQLIQGLPMEPLLVNRFLSERGWEANDCYRLFAILPEDNYSLNSHNYLFPMRDIHYLNSNLHLFYAEGVIVALERFSDSPIISAQKDNSFGTGLAHIGLRAGISMIFCGYQHLKEAMLQAQASLHYTCLPKDNLMPYEEIYPRYLTDTLNVQHNLLHYCHPMVLRFHTNDPWEKELLHTLTIYLENGQRISLAAKSLNIHRNTLLNRLRNIEEILGLQLEKLNQNMKRLLLISCMLVEQNQESSN